MDPIAERGRERWMLLVLDRADDFAPPPGAYTCLLWDARGGASPDERARLARKLVESGCLYVVCGGADSEAWHDAVDETLAALQVSGAVGEDRAVMSTWHDGETAAEAATFFVHAAVPPDGAPDLHLVVQMGLDWDRRNDLWASVRGEVLYG